jgi:hypothetical protein
MMLAFYRRMKESARGEEMDDGDVMRSGSFLAALVGVGVLLCVCRPSPGSPPTPAARPGQHSPALDIGRQRTSPESPKIDDDSPAVTASLAADGGMMLLQQQLESRESCLAEGCQSNLGSFLTLQNM